MAKANADYDRLLRHTQADLSHFALRLKRSTVELEKLLAKVPERARIMQVIEHHGRNQMDVADAQANVGRYTALLAKRNESEDDQESEE